MLGNQHTLVLPYLEQLCAHDETVVRERAVNSITRILDLYSDNDINNYIIPLVSLPLSRFCALPPTKPTSPAESQPLFSCVTFIRELDPTKKKFVSTSAFTQQIFRHFQWRDAPSSESNCNQNLTNVPGLWKIVCPQRPHQHPQASFNRRAGPDSSFGNLKLQRSFKDSDSRLKQDLHHATHHPSCRRQELES